MEQNLLIAEAMGGEVRVHIADTTALVEEARQAHDLWPTSCAALGRVLTVNALVASDLKKPDEKVVVTINGKGPAGTIVTQADGAGNVRGFIANPKVDLVNRQTGKLDVGGAVGTDGDLRVARDLGLKEPFTGVVRLHSGEIGDDFAYYFALSEQTASIVAVGVLMNKEDGTVKAAGGMIAQLLPDASEETITAMEKIQAQMKPMSFYIDNGFAPEEILAQLFADGRVLEKRHAQWYCGCSKEHFADAMALIAEEDLLQMIREDHGAEVVCQYCGKTYHFSEEEMNVVLEKHRNVENRKRIA